MILRYFECFFLKSCVCLELFCSSFKYVFIFVLQEKCPRIKCKSDPQRPSTVRRAIEVRGWWPSTEVQAIGKNSGKSDQVWGRQRESTDRHVQPSTILDIVQVPEDGKILRMKQQKA